jgi:transposase-like protein
MSEKKRRKWTANEKPRIVLTCLQPGVEVSEVCRREGINPTMFSVRQPAVLTQEAS